jgi:anti-sigma regulatory factor (Ser/Thr protein kinase)
MGGINGITDELDITCLAAWTVAGQVRMSVECRLAAWGLSHLASDVALVAGELVANAVRSTPEREIRVRFAREDGAVLFGVWDGGAAMPVVATVKELALEDVVPDPQALDEGYDDGTGGWGLPIVQALSAECGVRRTVPAGKWVWARLKV